MLNFFNLTHGVARASYLVNTNVDLKGKLTYENSLSCF
jgi:hypothetical protein